MSLVFCCLKFDDVTRKENANLSQLPDDKAAAERVIVN